MYQYCLSSAGRGDMPFLMSFALEPEIMTLAWIDNASVQFPLNIYATNPAMKTKRVAVTLGLALAAARLGAAEDRAPKEGESPADHLPPHITQVTWFGERADWSHDGKKILFLSKTFGDAMELELATKRIRNLTAHYPHHGYTRALYLANGDIILSGPEAFDPKRIGEARAQCWLYVLDRNLSKPASPLGTKCSE